ncbi:GH32 C-terminal domain-containing protein [Agromyces aurantiacus]|uniref:beta-fructofuranosidase n=1 Tax=Agromyces aurantiacus TaxID=165814 RepID=A0ABV9R1W0_9MICO|nr:GH32 C-terminal domain-containing protein [Agromyces aurantiacus]MBM7505891.1 sucrose-6-phosphate hydrolase SacC (GH32 family) [Agromyces aurantiacus]
MVDVRFEGDPLAAIDLVGGRASIECTADDAQRAVLLSPRSAPAAASSSCLYLDGWTTRVVVRPRAEESASEAVLPLAAFVVEAWFAPRAFGRGDERGLTVLVDARGRSASFGAPTGFALGHDRAGRIAAEVGGEFVVGDPDAPRLEPGRWHRLALAVVDGQVELLLDGRRVTRVELEAAGPVGLVVPDRIVLGQPRDGERVEGLFPVGAAVGVLGPIRISAGAAQLAVDGVDPSAAADVAPDRARYAADPHHPIAHLSAPQGWMNEPHAAVQADGVHHVFFQHNPAGPYWGHIAWGHAVSRDLVHWQDAGLAVTPGTSAVAPDGAWSGSSVLGPGGEHLLYVTAGDASRAPDQRVVVARPTDSGWATDDRAVLEMPRSAPGRTEPLVAGQFRDPFVWREGDDWFLAIGAGLEGSGGTALLFHSLDGEHWEQQAPLLVGDVARFPATGVMWELPVLLPVGTGVDGIHRHALFVAPWWAGPSEHHLQHVWHWIGVWDAAARRFTPDHDEPREFDGGGHLTGPSGTVFDDGRAILWTIAQDTRSLGEFAASGWAHNAGLPLELGLHEDGTLLVRPVAELAAVRDRAMAPVVEVPDVAGDGSPTGSPTLTLRGRHLELDLDVEGSGFEIEVLRSADGIETTVLGVTGPDVWIDRSRSSRDPSHVEARRRAIRRPDAPVVRARLVIDGSMIELYVDDRVSLTSRAYPVSPDADGLRLRVLDGARIIRLAAFELHSAYRPRTGPRTRKAHLAC